MTDTDLTNRIQKMRQKYVDHDLSNLKQGDYTCQDIRKAKTKKRLIALEKERCHRLIEHADVSHIDQKIASLKSDYIKESVAPKEQGEV
ncbi:hypothetical protein N1496_06165 [Streptococcus didelphis]|uniref:Uncharacterized protein n=1 Tax=Streptococcus didelphis TaxID=102886 RepID=A0ABY9LHQ5_9STRE|nr:hypothetical protein [Streptococcus didelphis]WMB27690.1 hypothetical protein N1496_06165 [Streptococcus didelphis]